MKLHKRRDYQHNITWCGLKENYDKVVVVSLWRYANCKECYEACLSSTNEKGYSNNCTSKLSAIRWYELRKAKGELE